MAKRVITLRLVQPGSASGGGQGTSSSSLQRGGIALIIGPGRCMGLFGNGHLHLIFPLHDIG